MYRRLSFKFISLFTFTIIFLRPINSIELNKPMIGQFGSNEESSLVTRQNPQECDNQDIQCEDQCNVKLKIFNLCAKTVKTRCLQSLKIKSKCICTERLDAQDACIENLNVSDQLSVNTLGAHNGCINQLVSNSLCADKIKVNDFQQCGKYRASAQFSVDTPYTLGTPLLFDAITDNPNGDLSNGLATTYNVPISGYYNVTVQVEQQDLVALSGKQILGVPVGRLEVLVNGIEWRDSFSPYLAFANLQKTTLGSIISLKAGDVVTVRYTVFILDQLLGLISVPGTVTVSGNAATEERKTLFKIYLVSNDCPPSLCRPCEVPAITGCALPCTPCKPENCPPCTPCV